MPEPESIERRTADAQALPYQPLDKNSFIPIPAQILAQLKGMIRLGRIPIGAPVPNEEELSRAYKVSRPAARHALELLRNHGYAVRMKARGTFACRPKVEKNLAQATGFTAELERLGMCAASRVIAAGRRAAGAEAAHQLAIFRGTPVFCLRRIRLADGVPVALEESCLEMARFAEIEKIDFSAQSLHRVLREQYGVCFTRVDEMLEAHPASRAEARLLEVSPRTCLLRVRRTLWGGDGRPVEASDSLFRGDRYRAVLKQAIQPE